MKLTYKEEIELKYLLLKGFNCIVRNEIGSVEVFANKPHRNNGHGYSTWVENKYPMTCEEMSRRRHTELGEYNFISWSDEPILISDLIRNQLV